MAYIMGLGSQPQGELYFSAAKDGSAGLYAHYYSGGNVKLIHFKPPAESPEEGSPVDRIAKNEDRIKFILEKMKEIVKAIKESKNDDLDPPDEIGSMLSDLETVIGTRDEYNPCPAAYNITNFDPLIATRVEE